MKLSLVISALNKLQVLVILIMTEIGCNSDDERSQNKWLVWPWTWDVQWLIESVPADILFYHWLNVKDLSSSSSSSCTPPNLEWFLMLVRPTVLVPHVKGKYFDCHRQHLDRQCGQCDSVTVCGQSSSDSLTSHCHVTLSPHGVLGILRRPALLSPGHTSVLSTVLWELYWWTCQHLKLWSLATVTDLGLSW